MPDYCVHSNNRLPYLEITDKTTVKELIDFIGKHQTEYEDVGDMKVSLQNIMPGTVIIMQGIPTTVSKEVFEKDWLKYESN